VLQHLCTPARAWEVHLQNVSHPGIRAIGHHHHMVGEEERLVDVVVTMRADSRSRPERSSNAS
jgi:hypothetical protein